MEETIKDKIRGILYSKRPIPKARANEMLQDIGKCSAHLLIDTYGDVDAKALLDIEVRKLADDQSVTQATVAAYFTKDDEDILKLIFLLLKKADDSENDLRAAFINVAGANLVRKISPGNISTFSLNSD